MCGPFQTNRLRRLPVLPIAVFLKPGHGGITRGEYRETLLGQLIVRFRYLQVAIPDVPREGLPPENPVRHALTPLLRHRNERPVE